MQRGACGCACGGGGGGAGGEVREELEVPWLDLEKGRGQDHMAVAPTVTADAMTEATRAASLDALDFEMETAVSKLIKCILRGFIVLLWVYLIDLMRRYVITHSVEELFFIMPHLGMLAVAVSVIFCFLMGSIDSCIPPIM